MYDRAEIRQDSNRLAGKMIIYTLLVNAVPIIALIVIILCAAVVAVVSGDNPEGAIDMIISDTSVLAAGQMIGCVCGLAFLLIVDRKRFKEYFSSEREMTAATFIRCFILVLASQFVFTIVFSFMEGGVNSLGYSMVPEGLDSLSDGSLVMSLYAVLIGPVIEELVFRRFIILNTRRYGRIFAIVISSLLFALYHGNIAQGLNTFMFGMILGYMAEEYSVKWSVLMHIINNSLVMLLSVMNEDISDTLQLTGYSVSLVLAIVLVVRHNRLIKWYIDGNRSEPKVYRIYLSSALMLMLIGIGVCSCVLEVSKL